MTPPDHIVVNLNQLTNTEPAAYAATIISGVAIGFLAFALIAVFVGLIAGYDLPAFGLTQLSAKNGVIVGNPEDRVKPRTRKILVIALLVILAGLIASTVTFGVNTHKQNQSNSKAVSSLLQQNGLTSNSVQNEYLLGKYEERGRGDKHVRVNTIGLKDYNGKVISYVYRNTGKAGVNELMRVKK